MQKLCTFARALTRAIIRPIDNPLGIAIRRMPHRCTNIPNAHSIRIRTYKYVDDKRQMIEEKKRIA
jgi:hypothetical protein